MRNLMKKLFGDTAGATAVEYGLILAMVFLAMVGAVANVGNATSTMWNDVSTTSQDAMTRAANV